MKNKAKCLNDLDVYNTKECLELHDKLHHSQQGREKVKKLKERNCRAIFKKREHRRWDSQEKDICVYLFRVRNKNTPGNQIEYVNKNGKIYNTIFTFKEDAPTEKNMADFPVYVYRK